MEKIRLDKYCTPYYKTRTVAADQIKKGAVKVNGKIITKPSYLVDASSHVEMDDSSKVYVSRAAWKLLTAFDAFSICIDNQVVLDIGASTGGFTQVCLEKGAKKVYALDVGHLQLSEQLQMDPRVIKMEGCNARYIQKDWFDEPIHFMCMDVSFISCRTILEAVFQNMDIQHFVVLIKPQFECGPALLNKNGVLKDKKTQKKIIDSIEQFIRQFYETTSVVPSAIQGRSGNQEYVLYAKNRRQL